jgi:hypothetical protein
MDTDGKSLAGFSLTAVTRRVGVEKLHFLQNSQNLGDTKCLEKRESRL